MDLRWSTYGVRGTTVLALTGRLCASTVLMLEPEMAWLLARERSVLVVDLAGLEVCDSAGLAMLDGCDRAAHAAGIDLRPASPTPSVCEALRARGLLSRLRVFGTVDGAIRDDAADLLSAAQPVPDRT